MKKILFFICLFLSTVGGYAQKPKRIISLSPSNTEILFALGAGDDILGVSRFCDYPEAAQKKEKVGDFIHPNLEKIVALKPDIVFAGEWKTTNIVPRLKKLGIRVIEIKLPRTLEEIYETIDAIAQPLGRDQQAKDLIVEMKLRLQKISSLKTEITKKPKVYIEVDPPNWTIAEDSFIHDAIEYLGLENIFGDIPLSAAQVSWESVVDRNPDIILLLWPGKEGLQKRGGAEKVAAIQNHKIIDTIEKNLFNRPTPRIVLGMEQLAQKLERIVQ